MLDIKNLTCGPVATPILNDISLTAKKGEITAVIGPSGSGKTTLLRCVAQLQEWQGDILLEGVSIGTYKPGTVGLAFQAFHLFPHLSVWENITFAALKKGLSQETVFAKAADLLDQFGLTDYQKSSPLRLSGGQRQRVCIARALMLDPPLMLFDEPTSALDPELVNEVGDIIKNTLSADRTILLVTHEIRLAKRIAHRIIFLERGHILDNCLTADFFSSAPSIPLSERAQRFLNNLTY